MNVIEPLCRLVRPHFSDALDGAPLPFLAATGVRLHLTFCPWCRRHMVSLRNTKDALRALGAQDNESSSRSTKPSDSSGR